MRMRRTAAVAATTLLVSPALVGLAVPSVAPGASAASPAVQECEDEHGGSAARVRKGAKHVNEPALYSKKEAKKYGMIKHKPYLGHGAVTVETYVHVITEAALSDPEQAELETRIDDQMEVLNDSFSGATGGANTPFRFDLEETTWTVNATWAHMSPGKGEVAPKKALQLVVPRPGVAAEVDIGLVGAGDIEGAIVRDGGDGFEGLDVELLDESGKVVATTRTDFDGFFLFERVAYGRYTIRLAAESARVAKVSAALNVAAEISGEAPVARMGAIRVVPAQEIALNPMVKESSGTTLR